MLGNFNNPADIVFICACYTSLLLPYLDIEKSIVDAQLYRDSVVKFGIIGKPIEKFFVWSMSRWGDIFLIDVNYWSDVYFKIEKVRSHLKFWFNGISFHFEAIQMAKFYFDDECSLIIDVTKKNFWKTKNRTRTEEILSRFSESSNYTKKEKQWNLFMISKLWKSRDNSRVFQKFIQIFDTV